MSDTPVITTDQIWSSASIWWIVSSIDRYAGRAYLVRMDNGETQHQTLKFIDRHMTYLGLRCKSEIEHDGKKIRCVHIEGHDVGIGATNHGTVPGVMEVIKSPVEPPAPAKLQEPPPLVEVGQIWENRSYHIRIHICRINGQVASVAYAPGDREFPHSLAFIRTHCALIGRWDYNLAPGEINRPRPTPDDPLGQRSSPSPIPYPLDQSPTWGAAADWKKIHGPLDKKFPRVVVGTWAHWITAAGYESLIRRIPRRIPVSAAQDDIWFTAPILWPVLEAAPTSSYDEAVHFLKAHRLLEPKPWYAKGTLPDFGFDE